MKPNPQMKKLSQQKIDADIEKLANSIFPVKNDYSYVVGIARGGLHISRPLAKKLKLKHTSIKISFYTDGVLTMYPQKVDVSKLTSLPKTKKMLIVDDLVDGGHTIQWLNENISEYIPYDVAVLYWNQHNSRGIYPKYYADFKPEGWVVFPWDK